MKINQNPTKQVFLPSQYELYKQLDRQINIREPSQRQHLKFNFKQKYQQHLTMIKKHAHEEQRFELHRQQQLLEREKKLKQMKEYIGKKQNYAKDNHLHSLRKRSQKAKGKSKHWKQIVNKSHKEYIQALDKSVKLIKKWDDKGQNGLSRKNSILSKISNKFHEHNQYVSIVASRSKEINSRESQRSLQKLNPQLTPFKPNLNKILSRYELQKSSSKHSRLQSSMSNKSLSKNKSSYQKHLKDKQSIDEIDIEQSLCKSIEKQKKIDEARNLRKYLQVHMSRMSSQRSKQKIQKLQENKKQIEIKDRARKKQIQMKFKDERIKGKRDISLPIIRNKIQTEDYVYLTSLQNGRTEDNSQKYNSAIVEKLRNVSLMMNINKKKAHFFD